MLFTGGRGERKDMATNKAQLFNLQITKDVGGVCGGNSGVGGGGGRLDVQLIVIVIGIKRPFMI